MHDNPYAPPQAHLADFSPASRREEIEGFRDLTGLVRWLRIALAALAVIVLAHAVSLWLQIGYLSSGSRERRPLGPATASRDRARRRRTQS